ncbi:MAG: Na(+)/H(+) antiporter subunit B [candidate division WS2 bacterium]|nr:Na(+)/H(+) antiporter subunit B [Candidatus Lithacetigena glycinireducens]
MFFSNPYPLTPDLIQFMKQQGMTLIVRTITRLTVGFIMLFGLYIMFHGHLTPGGGFVGGVIFALAFVHLMFAYGKRVALKKFSPSSASIAESIGALLFVSVALFGIIAGYFFINFLPVGKPFEIVSAGTIPVSNIAIFLKVGAGLFSIFLALTLTTIITQKTENTDEKIKL